MNLHICPKNIDCSLIDFENFSYSISPDRRIILDESFKKSIARHGILHPPIIKEIHPDSYVIVAGRKRLLAWRSLVARENCCCMIIQAEMPEIEIFSILLEEILSIRPLTLIERAIFLKKISPLVDEKYITREIMPRIGLPPNPANIKRSTSLLILEAPIIQAIHYGNINEKVAQELVSLSGEDRLALFQIISYLQLSVSNQKKLFTICHELASRENRSIATILEEKDVQHILNHLEANPPQKTKKLMNWLSRKYMPRSSYAADEFKRFTASMHLPPHVSVNHTPFFEDDAVTLSITFSNKKSVQNAWEKIKNTIRKQDN